LQAAGPGLIGCRDHAPSLKGSSYGLIQNVVASQFSCHLLGDCIIFSGQGTAPCCFDVFTVASWDVHCPPALVVAVSTLNIWRWRFRLLLQVFSSVANANTRFAYTASRNKVVANVNENHRTTSTLQECSLINEPATEVTCLMLQIQEDIRLTESTAT
jgi:hypothetical protein